MRTNHIGIAVLALSLGTANADSSAQQVSQWRVQPRASVQIGASDGDSTSLLYRVRGAHKLSDGRVVLANAGSYELRYYSAAGRFIASVGKRGGGPGEFEQLSEIIRLPGDTILAYDSRRAVRTWVAPNARVMRTDNVDRQLLPRRSTLSLLPDGSFLVVIGSDIPLTAGSHRPPTIFARMRDSAGNLDTLAVFPGMENYRPPEDVRTSVQRPFFRNTEVASSHRLVYLSDNDKYEIGLHTYDGKRVGTVTRAAARRPVTARQRNEARERLIASGRSPGMHDPVRERMLRNIPIANTMPAHGPMVVDELGNLWVQQYSADWEPSARHWRIYDPLGREIAAAETPPGLRVLSIGSDHVIGVVRDEADVEYVRIHALRK